MDGAPRRDGGRGPSGLRARAERLVQRLASRRPRLPRRLALILSVVLFAGATAVGIANLPELEHGVRWWLLVVVGLLAWVGAVANAGEYAISAAMLGHHVPLVPAMRVAVVATAANLLPVPGAVLVRTRALKQLGSSYGASLGSTAIVGLGFVATALVLAGGFQAAAGPRHAAGGLVAGAGIVLLGAAWLAMRSRAGGSRATRLSLALVGVEAASVGVKALRFYLVVVALGFSVTPAQALALTLAQVVALALGIFPSGLGITEVLAAVISPAVGLDAAVGLTASAVFRLTGLVCFAVLALAIAATERRGHRTAVAGPEPSEVP